LIPLKNDEVIDF